MSNEKIGAMHWMYQQIMNDANISPAFKEALPVNLSVKLDGPTFAEACQQMNQALRPLEEDYLRRMAMRSIESDVDALDEAFADQINDAREPESEDDGLSRYSN